jgi:hypothetical protein
MKGAVVENDCITLYAERHRDITIPSCLVPTNVNVVMIHIVQKPTSVDRAALEQNWRRDFVSGLSPRKPTIWQKLRALFTR